MAGTIIKNLTKFKRELEREDKRRIKAAQNATKVEGFRLRKKLVEEIKEGSPGGMQFSPLREIAKARQKGKGKGTKSALQRLAFLVRYATEYKDGGMKMSIGYIDPHVSRSWQRIVTLAQQTQTKPISAETRKGILEMGYKLKKKGDPAARFFMLRPDTKTFTTPARPILEPFWSRRKAESERNIIQNFERKMRGERI